MDMLALRRSKMSLAEQGQVARRAVLVLVCLLPIGCHRSEAPLYEVHGEVFFKGEPAAGALVHFHPVEKEGGAPAFATVEDDGTFQLSTRTSYDGAMAGDYKVTVNWRDEKEVDGETIIGPDRLGGRYARPGESNLQATVTEGENEVPRFNLK